MNLRKYGKPLFRVAVIHGGPGAAGEMSPVAGELSQSRGVLEPLQTAKSIEGQVDELKEVMEEHASPPVTLIGFSWGAWLSFIFAAEHPELTKKIILVSSGPFEQKYADKIMLTRLSRLSDNEKIKVTSLINDFENNRIEDKSKLFAEFGKLLSKADSFNPIEVSNEKIDLRYDIYQSIWKEAEQLRKSGDLLEYGKKIQCPVTAIHGDYDPHPADGVKIPLSSCIKDFRFILLPNCGHKPWLEKQAQELFYNIIEKELQ